MVDADAAGELPGADDAAGRPGKGHLDGPLGRRFEGHLPAVRFDRGDMPGDAPLVQPAPHGAQVAAHERLDVGVRDGRGRALELLPLGQDLIGNAHGDIRARLGEERLRLPLVVRRDEGEQEVDRDRLDAAVRRDRAGDGPDPLPVERPVHLAAGQDPLVDLVAVAPLDQGLRLDPGDVVMALALAPLDERHVAKARGGHVGDRGALALEDRVGRDRGAEADVVDRPRIAGAVQAVEDAVDRVGRGGEGLPDVDRAGLGIVAHEVGERTAHVDPDQAAHASRSHPPRGGAPNTARRFSRFRECPVSAAESGVARRPWPGP